MQSVSMFLHFLLCKRKWFPHHPSWTVALVTIPKARSNPTGLEFLILSLKEAEGIKHRLSTYAHPGSQQQLALPTVLWNSVGTKAEPTFKILVATWHSYLQNLSLILLNGLIWCNKNLQAYIRFYKWIHMRAPKCSRNMCSGLPIAKEFGETCNSFFDVAHY